MSNNNQENNDSQDGKQVAQILRQRDSISVSPIDLSMEITKPLRNTEELQWINFYEPPEKLFLKNSGDTVIIIGRWLNQGPSLKGARHLRPTLKGGPLEGQYVFSQIHYHWNSPHHEQNKHTVNGKSNLLEMHALFYKSCYGSQAEAQEKEDGIVIVVYFFKVEGQSESFKWLTDHLQQVTAVKTATQLPPAPLSALLLPFTRDYLVYWGALPCTCHHVLWMVSRSALRISREELEQFGKLQTDFKEKNNNMEPKTMKVAQNVYKVNATDNNFKVIIPGSVDPPCKIITKPNKITITTSYCQENNLANKFSEGESSFKNNSKISPQIFIFEGKGISGANSDFKNDQQLCSFCKTPAGRAYFMNRFNQKLPGKTCVLVSQRSALEIERVANTKQIKILEKEKSKNLKKRKLLEFGRLESEVARRLLKKEKEEIQAMKKALDDELRKLALIHASKETSPNNDVVDVLNTCPKRARSPNLKSVLTSRPNSVCGDQNNLQSEKENIETNSSKSVPNENDKSPVNAQNETTGDQPAIKEEEEIKKIVEPSKSKLPVRTSTPWKSEGLQSTYGPYFRSKGKQASEKQPETPGTIRINTRIPKFNRRVVNRTVNTRQDLGGKGDQPVHSPNRVQQKPLVHLVSYSYLQ